jgi:flavodoxin
MTWKDWSYFKSQPYLRDSEIPSDMIVLYYSRSGKTEAMARLIAQRFNADIFKISDQSYYQGLLGILRANRDAWFQKSARITTDTFDFKKYRLIFVGSPIWWYRPAPPLWTFVQNNNFEGRYVILFNTFNSRFKEGEIDKFGELVEKQGGIFLDHVHVRRGRIYNQLSGDEMVQRIENLLDENELIWRREIGRIDSQYHAKPQITPRN